MSQTDPFRPHNPGEYPEDPYAGEPGTRSDFGTTESVPPAVPPTGTSQPVPPIGTDDLVPPTVAPGQSSNSTTDAAKDQAGEMKDTTKQAGQQVVQETKQQAAQVAAEAKSQTGNLLRQGVDQINSQAGQQQQRLAQGVHSIAKELGSMASSSDESGPMTDLAHDASRRAGEVAHWLETHEPSDILDGLRSFARRRPGTFLLGAAAAGVLVGRLTRGLAAEAKSDHRAGTQNGPSQQSLPGGYPAAAEPYPATEPYAAVGDQPYGGPPAGPEYSQAPVPGAGQTGWDDTLPRGLGEGGPR